MCETAGLPLSQGKDSVTQCIEYYEAAALKGHVAACVNLGRIHDCRFKEHRMAPLSRSSSSSSGGLSGGQSLVEALKWYQIASDKGDKVAAFNLSVLYGSGVDICSLVVEVDIEIKKAKHQQGTKESSAHGSGSGDSVVEDGEPVVVKMICTSSNTANIQNQNHVKSIEYLMLAAERGHWKGCYNLARRKLVGGGISDYLVGGGVEFDYSGAISLLQRASNEGQLMKASKLLKFLSRKEKEEGSVRFSQNELHELSSLYEQSCLSKKQGGLLDENDSMFTSSSSSNLHQRTTATTNNNSSSEAADEYHRLQNEMNDQKNIEDEEELLMKRIKETEARAKARAAALKKAEERLAAGEYSSDSDNEDGLPS
jgi:TPR repeat protein